MKMLEAFRSTAVADCYLFVSDTEPSPGQHDMFITDETAEKVNAWAVGPYDTHGSNRQIGEHVSFEVIGSQLLRHVFVSMQERERYEQSTR